MSVSYHYVRSFRILAEFSRLFKAYNGFSEVERFHKIVTSQVGSVGRPSRAERKLRCGQNGRDVPR